MLGNEVSTGELYMFGNAPPDGLPMAPFPVRR